MTEPNHTSILYGWNLVSVFFGYIVLGLTWQPLVFFMFFVNAVLLHVLYELYTWQQRSKDLEAKLRQRTQHAFTEDFAQRLKEEINKRVEDALKQPNAGFTYRAKQKVRPKPEAPRYPPRGKPINNAMKLYGLQWGYTQEQVNSAYRNLVKKYHPDLHGGKDTKIKQVNIAKDWLDKQIREGLNK